MIVMRKYLLMLCLPAVLAWIFISCSKDDVNKTEDDGESLTEEIIGQRLVGEWICYYQYWEESEIDPYQEEAWYNTDDLSLTFNEDFSAYLKREGDDELLEIGSSQNFTYGIMENTIHAYIYGEVFSWNILSLTETELEIKRKDGDYIIIAKFTKRASLSGKVSGLSLETEYSDWTDRDSYSFSYDFKGELKGIAFGNKKLTYEPRQNNEMYINWYNGDRLRLVDNKEDGYAEVFHNNTSVVSAKYDKNGLLTDMVRGAYFIHYEYSDGNMSVWKNSNGIDIRYEYSKEKNDSNIDLNYFIDTISSSRGNSYDCANYMELGLGGKKSANLISGVFPGKGADVYFTYSYEKAHEGRISKIIRSCISSFDDTLLNKCTISVEYYD